MSVVMNEDRATVDNTTTRRFSRTLAEAFPDERAHAIEPWRKTSVSDALRQLLRQVAGFALALLAAALLFAAMADTAHAGRRDGGCCYPVPRGTAQ